MVSAPPGPVQGLPVAPGMGLTLGQRKAVTKAITTRYKRASRAQKDVILDELCAFTG